MFIREEVHLSLSTTVANVLLAINIHDKY